MTATPTVPTKKDIFWNYFLALESDLLNLSRYVEISHQNKDTYSIELAKLLLAASSEVDVVMKALCNLLDSNSNPDNIGQYETIIERELPALKQEWVYLDRFSLKYQPWINWRKGNSPTWWNGNNKVKHHRETSFGEANLQNAVNSVCALLVVIYFYETERYKIGHPNSRITHDTIMGSLVPKSSLLTLDDKYYPGCLLLE